jgi:MoaA/NifB/PqqE/SkfB family radical SAM enzyme
MDFREAVDTIAAYRELSANAGDLFSDQTPVLTAKVKLLWHCNLACSFCKLPAQKAIMSRETARNLAQQLHDHGLRKVHFSGGEVLTHPDCFDIFADWSALGIQVNITSNGFLMGKDEIRRLESTRVHSVSLSIDAADHRLHDNLRGVKGSHKAVTRAAIRIAERGKIRLRINTVVSAHNCNELEVLRSFVRDLGQKSIWKLIPVDSSDPHILPDAATLEHCASLIAGWPELEDRIPFGSTEDDFRNVSKGINGFLNRRCFAPWFHLFFSPDGFCYPCCMARGSAPPLGQFPEESIAEILSGTAMRSLRSSFADGEYMECCSRCDDFQQENLAIEQLCSCDPP